MEFQKYPIISDRKIKFGIVGCGRISKNHIDAINSFPEDAELISVCDVDKNLLREISKRLKVNFYTDLNDMLSNEALDALAICTPSGLHSEHAILAANRDVNVITEKPMATKFADGKLMVKTCERKNVRLFVVKQNRLNPTIQLLKRAIDEKRFGDIKLVHLNVLWNRNQEYYEAGNGWRGTWEYDGGAFMNQASHYIDLVDWLIGPVEKVQAMTSTTRSIEAEDTGVINLKWRNGALGSLAVTMLTYKENFEGSISIIGEFGTVRVGGVAVNKIEKWDFKDIKPYDTEVYKANYDVKSVYGNGHKIYYQNVLDVLKGRALPLTDGREGLKSLELLSSAYMAARDNVTIGLPLEF